MWTRPRLQSSSLVLQTAAEVQIIASNLSFRGHCECALRCICFSAAFFFGVGGAVHEAYSRHPPSPLPFSRPPVLHSQGSAISGGGASHFLAVPTRLFWLLDDTSSPGGIGLAVMGGESGYFSRGRKRLPFGFNRLSHPPPSLSLLSLWCTLPGRGAKF